MTLPFHVMTFETRFLNKLFSPQIQSNPPSPQEMEQRNKKEKGKRKERSKSLLK
jgi:hypothetical protein